MQYWQTSRRQIPLDRPLVMGILNVTPDSFSDGSKYANIDAAVERVAAMVAEGADIIDIGGESTRPGGTQIDAEIEISRTAPIIAAIAKRFEIPISIDTTKSAVARRAIDSGAEIINDISGLRWEPELASIAAASGAGLVLMHSRGDFQTMHSQPPLDDMTNEVIDGLGASTKTAIGRGVRSEQIVLDIGIGFGKTVQQNLELIANLAKITEDLQPYPVLVGASRKSFLGKILNASEPSSMLSGSLAAAAIALWNGASILRVHDVKETVDVRETIYRLKSCDI